jgi:hypothetical protein
MSWPPSSIDDPAHWRQRAAEMRTLVARTGDPASRNLMLLMAEDCERVAERLERAAKS